MRSIVAFVFLSTCFLTDLRGAEEASKRTVVENMSFGFLPSASQDCARVVDAERNKPKVQVESIGFVWETDLLMKFSPIKFLLSIPFSSKTLSKKIDQQATLKLKQLGKVIAKEICVQHMMEDKLFLHSPSLIFTIRGVQAMLST